MHTKLEPIVNLLKQAHKQLSDVNAEDVGDEDNEQGYEDMLNDADGNITDAIDLLQTIV